jgi:hypothetical protein
MNEESYLNERLEEQISWYDDKSATNKKWFRICQFTQIVIASLITLSGIFAPEDFPWVYYTIPVLGAIIAITSGILGLYKFQENWLEYRTTTESLRHEKYLFLTKSEPYNTENPLNLLVSRVETLISKENTNWAQYMRKVSKDKSA